MSGPQRPSCPSCSIALRAVEEIVITSDGKPKARLVGIQVVARPYRVHRSLRSLDAIHLASAQRCQSWPLLTNDERMRQAARHLAMPLGS